MVHRRTLKHSIRNFKDTLLDILGKRTVYHLPSLYFLSYNREYVMNFSQSHKNTLKMSPVYPVCYKNVIFYICETMGKHKLEATCDSAWMFYRRLIPCTCWHQMTDYSNSKSRNSHKRRGGSSPSRKV